MKRHNQSPASMPNAPMDLTPLLDVIFIFLFVMIIYSAQRVEAATQEAKDTISGNEGKISLLKDENVKLHDENTKLKSEGKAWAELNEEYKSISENVLIVQIHCEAKPGTSGERTLFVESPSGELLQTDFNDNNTETTYERLGKKLRDYIAENSLDDSDIDSDRGNNKDSDEKEMVIVLSVNTKDILRTDKNRISSIIKDLKEEYKNVY